MNTHVPRLLRGGIAVVFAVLVSSPGFAQSSDDVATRLQELQAKLDQLTQQTAEIQKQIDELRTLVPPAPTPRAEVAPADDLSTLQPIEAPGTAADPTTPEPPPPDTATLDAAPVQNASSSGASKALNPDISINGNFVGHAGNPSPLEERKAFSLDETEIGLEAFVDPYAKAKFFVSITDEGAEIEEGFINFISLPADLTAKVGSMRANFGKINTMHTHARPWVDQPLVLTRFLGPEGLGDSGISVSKLLPNRFNLFVEATAEVLDGDLEGVFGDRSSNGLLYVGHLKLYRDLSESSNVELGTSFARGTLPEGGSNRFGGADVTFRWKPLQRAIYNSFIGRAEVMVNDRDDQETRASGFYTSADYQLARRWFTGVRYDQSDRPDDPRITDRGASATLTFWPSEFAQIRGQFRHMLMDDQPDTNELLLQVNFSIGAHAAHTF